MLLKNVKDQNPWCIMSREIVKEVLVPLNLKTKVEFCKKPFVSVVHNIAKAR